MPYPQGMQPRPVGARSALKARPIHKSSISDEIVQQIMKQISNGSLHPGQRLPSERELCKQFNAARSSLREALRCLSIMGVLSARVGEGTTVAKDGTKFLSVVMQWRMITERYDVRNLMELRIGLEGLAAACSAERATDEDLAELTALVEQMQAAVDDEKRFSALDLKFHLAIARCSGNPVLVDMLTMIRGQLARAVSKVLTLPDARPLSFREHLVILKTLKKRAPEKAREAMRVHLTRAIRRYDMTQG